MCICCLEAHLSPIRAESPYFSAALRAGATTLEDTLMGLLRAIMKRAEPLIQGDHAVGIVALEILVVQIMLPTGQNLRAAVLANFDTIKACMPRGWRQSGVQQVKEDVKPARGQNQVGQHTAEVQEVLAGVHGKARPRTGVDVLVMMPMGQLIKRRPMQEPMHQVKVNLSPGRR